MPSYRYFVLSFCLLVYGCLAEAQLSSPKYLGTKTPYVPLQTKHTPPPAAFKPIFINYVGRHGARFMTKAGSDVMIVDVLQQAANQHLLTATGEQIMQAAAQFEDIERGNYENITLLGAAEQKGIAERLYNEYRNIFKQRDIDVLMTTKVRTQQSANAFLTGLPANTNENINRTINADTADAMLRFYDMSPAYDRYKKSKVIQQHTDSLKNDKRMMEVADAVCRKLFQSKFIEQISAGNITADAGSGKKVTVDAAMFTEALYDVYAIHFSAAKEIKQQYAGKTANNFVKAFTTADLQWLSLVNDADDFYAKGPAEDTLGIQVTIAAPLLADFISTTDSIVNGSKHAAAVLRFTHAEAISPFATLLGIPEASNTSASVYTIQHHWQASQIIPLSANIQWIIYTDGKDYLLKVLLNEKEVALPVATTSFPYYNWQKVRQYYLQKLNRPGMNLQSDRNEYLLRVK